MAQLFHRSSNSIAKASLIGFVLAGGALFWFVLTFSGSPYVTNQDVVREQPVPFSHKHHVGGLGMDCRYCHTSVETGAFAGIPPVKTCMNCHSEIWNDSPMLEPVREAFREDAPIEWLRVHDLPDFVYFDHSIHIDKGIGCVTCHGDVGQMPLTRQVHSLHMKWCLECHREPEKFIRPREFVYDPVWQPEESQTLLGNRLVQQYNVQKLQDCSVCHR